MTDDASDSTDATEQAQHNAAADALAHEEIISASGLGDGDTLGQQVTRGFQWSFAGQILSRIGIFITGIVIVRLLTPHDFGVYAVALAAFNLLIVVNEVGMMPAVVRASDDELADAARTGATLAFLWCLFVAVGAYFGAPWFSHALGAPQATPILRFMIIAVLIDGAMTVPMALLAREFKQRRTAVAEAVGLVVYIVTAISLAYAGAGPWTIAVGRVVSSLVTAVLMFALAPRFPRPGFDRVQARKMLRFGIPLTIAAVVAEMVLNVDYLVVGRVLGPVSLGIYLLAFNLSTWPVSAVLVAIGRVAFAGFARLADDRERMADAYTRAVGLVVTATIPLAVTLAALSTTVIRVLYGTRWLAAATPLRYLLVLAVGRVVIQTTLDFIAAKDAPVTILLVQTAWLIALVPALAYAASRHGIAAVGLGHMAVVVLWVFPLLGIAMRRRGVRFRTVALQFVRPVVSAGVAVIAVEATAREIGAPVARLLIAGTVGVVVYLVVLVPRNPLVAWGVKQVRGSGKPAVLSEV